MWTRLGAVFLGMAITQILHLQLDDRIAMFCTSLATMLIVAGIAMGEIPTRGKRRVKVSRTGSDGAHGEQSSRVA